MRRLFASTILLVVFLGSAPGQGNSDAVLARLGRIEVHNLPYVSHGSGPLRSRPFLPPDADVFEQEKSQAQSGAIATTGTVIKGSPQGLNAGAGFPGLTLSDTPGYVPPDTQVSAGLNSSALELVEIVNGTLRISGGVGNAISTIDLCGFFLCDFFTEVISDPIVRYDPGSQRWFVSVVTIELVQQGLSFVSEGQWRLAVSTTSDPNGAWTVYGVTMSNGTFPDFPKLGISSDKVVQTGDAFTISTSRFKGTEFAVLNKQDLLNGVPVPGFQYFGPPQGLLAIHSVISSSSTLYMAAVGSGRSKSSSSR